MQPETRPISQDQLVAEVKVIYVGLAMVERKCIQVDNPETQTTTPSTSSAMVSGNRTNASNFASKYGMPARMWRHGMHSFLELLSHHSPSSDPRHMLMMLAFIYLAYPIMALLYETVPAFEDTWIECLGDLARKLAPNR
ncbi:hypothetical protein QBC35DRAFT_518994 [Podospora australis]|uniref:Uncharacterized protein n=1 Tax=Podospora australis TaxID=1536484 RepID=A0AAN7ACH4_9PEZI|nr:hypothetical protein QBC35DRAFT_518994 [Podospora australis]